MLRSLLIVISCILLLAAAVRLGPGLEAPAKEWLSAKMLEQAWAQTLAGAENAQPFPWLDSVPVAKLSVPRLNRSFIVMRGTSGVVLALAPGWHKGTSLPGSPGISMISAHHKSHFSFLNDLQKGDLIRLQTAAGQEIEYEVDELQVAIEPQIKVGEGGGQNALLLSTTYPLANWRKGETIQLVVVARPVDTGKPVTS